jgi:tetratricopeptide (TPR) repeat protein
VANPAKRWTFLLVTLGVAAAISIPSFNIWLADHWDSSGDPQLWQRAANLEPGNALYWEHLGRFREFDFEHSDPKLAITFLKRSTEIDPGYDRLWMELAEAEESAGQFAAAKDDFEDARDAHPTSAEVHWRFGNYLVRQGDRDWGFTEIQKALNGDPTLIANAINVCWEASHSVPQLLGIAPDNSGDFYATALDFFLNRSDVNDAEQVWSRIANSGEYFEMQRAIPLVDVLVDHGEADAAAKTWAEALKVSGWEHDSASDGSLVFNGGFEHDIANGGLDWREGPISGATFSIDENAPHSGKQSLKISFDGSANIAFSNLQQFVPVKPNQKYEFSAYLKSEGITTDSGIHFALLDPGRMVGSGTQQLLGSASWTEVKAEITTSPQGRLLKIVLERIPSAKLDNKLSGTVWVDDVQLRPIGPSPKETTR